MKHQLVKKLAVFALAAGMLLPIAAPAVKAKAETKKAVWVLAGEKSKYMGYDGNYEDGYQSTYKYNTNGLLTVAKTVTGENQFSLKYTYKGTKISKRSRADTPGSGTYKLDETYTYNKNGNLAKMVRASDSKYVTKYTWKNGRCIKDALPYTGAKTAYSYDKNGYIVITDNSGVIWTMKYDKQGYMISESSGEGGATFLHKNTYKNGRLASRSEQDESGNELCKISYTYKKIKVPASCVEQVKLQQAWLTNKGGIQFLPLAAY